MKIELVSSSAIQNQVIDKKDIVKKSAPAFMEANTQTVTLEHLKNDCIIPVFSKDNESTVSHYEFIQKTYETAKEIFPGMKVLSPNIRVSHVVKGRVPSAIGKPAKELLEEEKTIYWERCAFVIDIPQINETVNGNKLSLSIGGVRAYNQENLYSKKTAEKFKAFIGFKNSVCCNLCISTDGFSNEIKSTSIGELGGQMLQLFTSYNKEKHLSTLEKMQRFSLNEEQFAHFIGKVKMYTTLDRDKQKLLPEVLVTDGQINSIIKNYYNCPNFSRNQDGNIDLWKLYNLFTGANKSSYI